MILLWKDLWIFGIDCISGGVWKLGLCWLICDRKVIIIVNIISVDFQQVFVASCYHSGYYLVADKFGLCWIFCLYALPTFILRLEFKVFDLTYGENLSKGLLFGKFVRLGVLFTTFLDELVIFSLVNHQSWILELYRLIPGWFFITRKGCN